jgi:hypothetical protein
MRADCKQVESLLTQITACRLPSDDDQHNTFTPDPLLRLLPTTPEPSIHQRPMMTYFSPVAEPEDTVPQHQHSNLETNLDGQEHKVMKGVEKDTVKPRKRRPLSWFPPSDNASGKASHMPKGSTVSAVERSTISAPVLTSTTNARVALIEGVHCGKIMPSGLATSSWDPESGWIADGAGVAKEEPDKLHEPHNADGQEAQPCPHPKGFSQPFRLSSARSASLNALSKVKEALTVRFRQASDPQTYRAVFNRDKFVRLEDDCHPESQVNDKLVGNQNDGRNLGRDKIRALTGRRHGRRKPIQHSVQDSHDALGEGEHPFLTNANDTSEAGCHRIDGREHQVDFHFEDLETSFAKAIDKLDFRIHRDKVSLTSLSSFFHSGKNVSAMNHTIAPQQHQGLPRVPSHPSAKTDLPQSLSPPPTHEQPASDQISPDQPSMGQCASRVFKCSSNRAKTTPAVYSYQMDPKSTEGIEKPDRDTLARRVFSRGHVNPLASHPDLTTFAKPPPPPPPPSTTMPQLKGTSDIPITKNDAQNDLEGAPIYSPSLENLSQYDRNTPISTSESANPSSQKLLSPSSRMPPIETPTRPSRHGAEGLGIAASYYRNGPSRSPNATTTTSYRRLPPSQSPNVADESIRKDNENQNPWSNLTRSPDSIHGSEVGPAVALKIKDENTKIVAESAGSEGPSNGGVSAGRSGNIIKKDDGNTA